MTMDKCPTRESPSQVKDLLGHPRSRTVRRVKHPASRGAAQASGRTGSNAVVIGLDRDGVGLEIVERFPLSAELASFNLHVPPRVPILSVLAAVEGVGGGRGWGLWGGWKEHVPMFKTLSILNPRPTRHVT